MVQLLDELGILTTCNCSAQLTEPVGHNTRYYDELMMLTANPICHLCVAISEFIKLTFNSSFVRYSLCSKSKELIFGYVSCKRNSSGKCILNDKEVANIAVMHIELNKLFLLVIYFAHLKSCVNILLCVIICSREITYLIYPPRKWRVHNSFVYILL